MFDKKYHFAFTVLLFILLSFSMIFAQPQPIPPLTEIVSYIMGDTTAIGEQIHTEYALQRGSVYFTLGQIQNDFPLTIVAVGDESMPRPKIKILVDEIGQSTNPFKSFNDITIEGIEFSGVDAAGSVVNQIFETGTTHVKITLKNCEIDSVRARAIRVGQNYCSVFASDCIVHNCSAANFNGRFIDGRSTLMDSVVIENSTFFNVIHALLCKFGGWERYVKFNHNTLFNLMRSPLRIVECPDIIVTNNLFIQTGLIGYETSWRDFYLNPDYANTDRDHWVRIELLPLTADTLVTDLGLTQETDFKNNNFWIDPAIAQAFPDTILPYMNIDFDFAKEMVGTDTLTWLSEDVGFTKAPEVRAQEMRIAAMTGGNAAADPGFDYSDPPYDFTYSTSMASYTAAAGGFPLGDLNWWPDKKAEWEEWIKTAVEESPQSAPTDFKLLQNYPNPFNPSTTIQYELAKAGHIILSLYDITGELVSELVNKKEKAGTYEVVWSGEGFASGVYFYTLKSEGISITKKMLLVK